MKAAAVALLMRLSAAAVAACALLAASVAGAQCTGDCNGNRQVGINELTLGVRLSLEGGQVSPACLPIFDIDGAGAVDINEVIRAVGNALGGCAGCPPLNQPFPPCRLPVASALCRPSGGVTLDGLQLESDGRLLRIDVLGLDPGLTYFATAGSTRTATITGVVGSRFGVLEPADGSIRAFDSRDNHNIQVANLVPTLRIDDCLVRQLYGGN